MEDKDLQKVEGLEHTYTDADGEKVYGRIPAEEDRSNRTSDDAQSIDFIPSETPEKLHGNPRAEEINGKTYFFTTNEAARLAKDAMENPIIKTKQTEDNMINGDDGRKIVHKRQIKPEPPAEVDITDIVFRERETPAPESAFTAPKSTRQIIEDIKEVTHEATTGENIENKAEGGAFDKTKPIGEMTPEELQALKDLYEPENAERMEAIKREREVLRKINKEENKDLSPSTKKKILDDYGKGI